jgi:hypothetical protein
MFASNLGEEVFPTIKKRHLPTVPNENLWNLILKDLEIKNFEGLSCSVENGRLRMSQHNTIFVIHRNNYNPIFS